ncbi:hypothetical protein [Endozoicomonas sp. SESOKO1]|uniref:hypothetical protein n=1 Tax=Endozoicomonas sp. SESOKO1 TaxID=2828742 RepID=UPI0021490515|nr:hypothetical protein [Endozoicomonas sp. SESOKO1]
MELKKIMKRGGDKTLETGSFSSGITKDCDTNQYQVMIVVGNHRLYMTPDEAKAFKDKFDWSINRADELNQE